MTQVSSFMGLQVALRGLLAQQRGLDVTSHNLANANTVGYTRQEAAYVAATALDIQAGALSSGGGALLGQGVEVEAYRRMRSDFLDLQFRGQNMALGGYETTAQALGNVEAALNEPGDNGINALLSQFWNAWSDVANNPDSQSARQALVTHGETLATAVRQLDARLAAVATDATTEYTQTTGPSGPVQAAADQIRRLNAAIADAMNGGSAPNDLLDQRDKAIDELSTFAQVRVTDNGDGTVRVDFGDAALPLVTDGTAPVNWPQTLTAPGGKLGALIDLGPKMAAYRADLNTMARQLQTSVNGLHGAPAFFSATLGAEASDITVAISAAAVRTGSGAGVGSNDIALAIAALRGGGPDQAYTNLIGRIGADAAATSRQLRTSQALVDNAETRRQEVAGVAVDEEVTNMIRFQRGYQASSRVMSTVDEMLDTLINRTGRVGL
jgi:flagellar hook-associated protein 1 FlgK